MTLCNTRYPAENSWAPPAKRAQRWRRRAISLLPCSVFQWDQVNRTVSFEASFNASAFQPVEVCGKEGILRFNGIAHDASDFEVIPDSFNRRKASCPTAYQRGKTPAQPNHMQNFFDCVRSRKPTKCNEDEGFIETATYLMALQSYREKRQVRWDPVKQQIV